MSMILFWLVISMIPLLVGLGVGLGPRRRWKRTQAIAYGTPPLQTSFVPDGANPNWQKSYSVGAQPNGLVYLLNNGAQCEAVFVKDYILIPVKIGTGPIRYWLLDSSISMNMIDAEYADEIGLPKTGDVAITDSIQRETHNIVRMEQIGIPNVIPNQGLLVFPRMDAIAADLSRIFKGLRDDITPREPHDRDSQSLFPLGPDDRAGVLGINFLQQYTTIIDYPRKRLLFTSVPVPKEMPSQGYITQHQQFAIPLKVQGVPSGPWIIRTGINFSLLEQPQPEGQFPTRSTPYRVFYLGRQINTLLAQRNLEISTLKGKRFVPHQTILTPFKSTNEAATWGSVGQLGGNVLKHFCIVFDSKTGKVVIV